MKKKYSLILPPVIFVLLIGISIFVSQLLSDRPLSSDQIHEQSREFASYTRESTLLLQEYEKDSITKTYLLNQLEQIQKQVLSLSETLSSAQITQKDEETVSKLLDTTEKYSGVIRSIVRTPKDKTLMKKALSELQKETITIDSVTKHYE